MIFLFNIFSNCSSVLDCIKENQVLISVISAVIIIVLSIIGLIINRRNSIRRIKKKAYGTLEDLINEINLADSKNYESRFNTFNENPSDSTLNELNECIDEIKEEIKKNNSIIQTTRSYINNHENEFFLNKVETINFQKIKDKIFSYLEDKHDVYRYRVAHIKFKLGDSNHNDKMNFSVNWVIGQMEGIKNSIK